VFEVSVSNDDGASWKLAERVGPAGAGTAGGWQLVKLDLGSIVTPTDRTFRFFVRCQAGTSQPSSVSRRIWKYSCTVVRATCASLAILVQLICTVLLPGATAILIPRNPHHLAKEQVVGSAWARYRVTRGGARGPPLVSRSRSPRDTWITRQ